MSAELMPELEAYKLYDCVYMISLSFVVNIVFLAIRNNSIVQQRWQRILYHKNMQEHNPSILQVYDLPNAYQI